MGLRTRSLNRVFVIVSIATYFVGLNFCNDGIYLNLTAYRHLDPILDCPMINIVEIICS